MPRLSLLEQQALARFGADVRAVLGARLVKLVLFGSRARGEGHEESDLDVLVLASSFTREERRRIIDAAHDVLEDTDLVISPIVRDEPGLARAFPLAGAVERDGVVL